MQHAHAHEDMHGHDHGDAHGHDHDGGHGHGHDGGHGHDHDDGHGHPHANGLVGRVVSFFRPHTHDIADQLDDALEASAQGIRTTKITLALLAATAAAQLVIALLSGSVALLADMIHNVADAMTSVPLWIAFVIGRRARTRRYTYGYRRAEDLAGIFIVVMIAFSAVVIGWESIQRLLNPEPMGRVGWVLAAGVIGVVGNELAAIYRIRVGRRIGSVALIADGYHARTDTIASFAVIIAAIGTILGFPILDPIIGLVITVMILWILKNTAVQVFRRLMDGVDEQTIAEIEDAAAQVPGIQEVGLVRARWSGHRLLTDLTVAISGDTSVADGHAIGEEVRHHLLHTIAHLEDAWVHVNPAHDGTIDPHETTSHHRS